LIGLTLRATATTDQVRDAVKYTDYCQYVRRKPDRAGIDEDWIKRAIDWPLRRQTQRDGRIRCWTRIPEANNRYLRVILLPDGETVHNYFLDRGFKP
jgi:hypothetical protein